MNGPILLPEESEERDDSPASSDQLSTDPKHVKREMRLREKEEARTLRGVAPDGMLGYWSTDKGSPSDSVIFGTEYGKRETIPYVGTDTGTVVPIEHALEIRRKAQAALEKPKITLKDRFSGIKAAYAEEFAVNSDLEDLYASNGDPTSYHALLILQFATRTSALRFRGIMEILLQEGTTVDVKAEAEEWDPDAKGTPYVIESYEIKNPRANQDSGKKSDPDVIVNVKSEDGKKHLAVSLIDLFKWNPIE